MEVWVAALFLENSLDNRLEICYKNCAMQNLSKLMKVYNLFLRGEDGEQETAAKILDQLLKQHGMSLEDLERAIERGEANPDEEKPRDFRFDSYCRNFDQVACQLVYSFGLRKKNGISCRYTRLWRGGTTLMRIWLTDVEYALFAAFVMPCYEAYQASRKAIMKRHREEMADLHLSFISANDLYSPEPLEDGKIRKSRRRRPVAWTDDECEQFDHDHEDKLADERLKLTGSE